MCKRSNVKKKVMNNIKIVKTGCIFRGKEDTGRGCGCVEMLCMLPLCVEREREEERERERERKRERERVSECEGKRREFGQMKI